MTARKQSDTIEGRAVKIAAKVLQDAGVCRYDDVSKCRRLYLDESTCEKCIKTWLLTKARKELELEKEG